MDGNYVNETTIVNEKYLKENESFKGYFLGYLENLINDIEEDMKSVEEERKAKSYYKNLEALKKECEILKEKFI